MISQRHSDITLKYTSLKYSMANNSIKNTWADMLRHVGFNQGMNKKKLSSIKMLYFILHL